MCDEYLNLTKKIFVTYSTALVVWVHPAFCPTGSPETLVAQRHREASTEKINIWGQFNQRSMSSFYVRRFQKRKKTDNLNVFFALLGYECLRAAFTCALTSGGFN